MVSADNSLKFDKTNNILPSPNANIMLELHGLIKKVW